MTSFMKKSVSQPKGFTIAGSDDMVYRLKRALHGLQQAPRTWYSKVDHHFAQLGFQRNGSEPTLYKKVNKILDILVVCLHVDDIIYMGSSLSMVSEFKEDMKHTNTNPVNS